MGIYSHLDGGFSIPEPPRNPRLTVRCEYPDDDLAPTVVSFSPARSYGLHTARDVHDWFLATLRNCEEFEVETDEPGEWPVPFSSDTVRQVVVE
jgi:hypothetical protein